MKEQNLFLCVIAMFVLGCQRTTLPPVPSTASVGEVETRPSDPPVEHGDTEVTVSFYGHRDGLGGKRTAAGERFDPYALTAAHRSLPFGTTVRITNPRNNRTVVVRINDRGPFVKGREYDLSYGAARALGIVQAGTAKVVARVLPR